MKTARNALKGYTYQNYIFTLLLAKMDTDREIVKIISEAVDTQNFDDAYIELSSGYNYRLQVKNYSRVTLKDIKVDTVSHVVTINGNENSYNPDDNNVFVINADIKDLGQENILGIPAINISGIVVVPLSEEHVANLIEELYQNETRALQIIQFGYMFTSSGKYEVTIKDLPPIITISTDLKQKTVFLRGVPESFSYGITYIEGKPGVGKSHYVNEIENTYHDIIIYRFWTSAQDPKLNERLKFDVFIEQIGLIAFQSPKSFTVDELVEQLCSVEKIIVIDGLDHVENYNPNDLNKYIDFLNVLNHRDIRVVILSRPMRTRLPWDKTELVNWNRDETSLYLAAAHTITDYSIQNKIFDISNGYPIITFFLAEHYLKYSELNIDEPVMDIFNYYTKLLEDVRTKSMLGIFAGNNSFFTFKELEGFFTDGLYNILDEFIRAYPYLFEIVENRASLVHDSFNTFLRRQNDFDLLINRINKTVCDSLIEGNYEYMARLSSFMLEEDIIQKLLVKYADFNTFETLLKSTVDYNSIAAFYEQLRRLLKERPGVLDIYQYYSFSLIYQIVIRNDLIGYEGLVFQVLLYISKNAEIKEQIYSSDIIWRVYLTCKEKPDSIKHYLENTMYDEYQIDTAYDSINKEITYFDCLNSEDNALEILQKIDAANEGPLKKADLLQDYLVSIWIHGNSDFSLYTEFKDFIETGYDTSILKVIQTTYHLDRVWAEHACYPARYRLHELGFFEDKNIFRQGNILDIINDKASEGSFGVATSVQSFLRLANKEKRNVDICNINFVWSMYAQRKDYSVYTIDTALITFEKKDLINESDSVEIINRLINQSEKGIRHLLATYIQEKGAEYTKRLVESGKIYDSELIFDPFEIGYENINCLPVKLIDMRIKEMIRYHYRSKCIEGREIVAVLRSKYSKRLLDALYFHDMKVMDGLSDDEALVLKTAGVEYVGKPNSQKKEPYTPFSHGCISREDFEYIRQTKMSAMEVSRYADGWYTCLPFVDLYDLFNREEIRNNFLGIIHQALFARVIESKHVGNWFATIGNIPALLDRFDVEIDWEKLFGIFLRFLDISLIYYPDNLKRINSIEIEQKV